MKRTLRTLSALLLALVLLAVPVLAADSSVTYQGGAEKFVFLPGSEYTDSDLFDGFKGAMPGDTLTETVTVKNEQKGCDKVKIYLRAVPHGADNALSEAVAEIETVATMEDFLSQLTMTVKQGDKVLFEATPAELGGLAENVLLGTFKYGETAELTVELSVPMELGNEYANRAGEVDWVFTAEEINDPKTTPQTGESGPGIWLYVLVMAICAALLAVVAVLLSKRKKKQ